MTEGTLPSWILLVLVLLAPRPLFAAEPTDADHARALRALLDSKEPDCAKLNGPYFAARQQPNPSDALVRALEEMYRRRERNECLVFKCPPGQTCIPPPERLPVIDYFDTIRQKLAECLARSNCTADEEMRLRSSLLDAVVVIVRRYPVADPLPRRVLRELTIVMAPEDVLKRCSELLQGGAADGSDVARILRSLATQLGHGTLSQEILNEISGVLEAFQVAATRNAGVRRQFAQSIGKLLRAMSSPKKLADVEVLVKELGKGVDLGRLLILVKASEDLNDPDKREKLARAVHLMLAHHPGLDESVQATLRKEGKPGTDLESQLVALARLMDSAEILELLRLREAAHMWRVMHSTQRRFRVLAVQRAPKGCPTSNPNACAVAQSLWRGFVSKLDAKGLQGADAAAVPIQEPAAIVRTAKHELEADNAKPNAASCASAAHRREVGDLCAHPYAGVYVARTTIVEDGVCATTYFASRAKDSGIAMDDDGTHRACATNASSAFVVGGRLAVEALRDSTLMKYYASTVIDPIDSSSRAPSWKQWVALSTLLAGAAVAVGGVVVSNTQPDSSAGDRLWQASLILLPSSLFFQIWDLAQ